MSRPSSFCLASPRITLDKMLLNFGIEVEDYEHAGDKGKMERMRVNDDFNTVLYWPGVSRENKQSEAV